MQFGYHSFIFICFFLPILMIFYQVLPSNLRKYVIILFNYSFLFLWSKLAVLLQICLMLITYLIGLRMNYFIKRGKDKANKVKVKRYMCLGIILNIGMLIVMKYTNFFLGIGTDILNVQFTPLRLFIPVGISYYALQHISYLIDISSHSVEAETNIFCFTMYTSFFATILQGPITRFREVKDELHHLVAIKSENAVQGYRRILWGLFKKVVIADRVAPAANYLFNIHTNQGAVVILAAILCTIQLYMDFSGTVDISIGAAQIFGIHLPENFRQPFFAKNATDFWHRWHITLSQYLRDYVFYPISLSKSMMNLSKWLKKHTDKVLAKIVGPFIALFTVWLCNGLWHGANILFILYGMYYFVLMVVENIMDKPLKKLMKKLKITDTNKGLIVFRFVKLLVIVCYGEMMCRVSNVGELVSMTQSVFVNFDLSNVIDIVPNMPMFSSDWIIMIVGVLVVFFVSVCAEKKIDLKGKFETLSVWQRWGILYTIIFIIIIFGAYGPGYDKIAMIYAGF